MNRLVAATLVLVGIPLSSQSAPVGQELRDVVPPDARMDQFAITSDGLRTYFVDAKGDAWLYDRTQKTRSRIVGGGVSDLSLSAARNALAFTRASGQRGDAFVWVIALNASTGLATAKERQLSRSTGDAPSVSPDGKLVAFARDDESGVGQSVVIVPLTGGKERVVAPALPSNVGNIRWTPDSRQLYIGVNQPVACVPEWSCLPLSGAYRQPPGSIRRVSTAGGPVTIVATARGVFPGLSPDGRTLVYLDTGSVRRWVVADSNGNRRDVIVLPPPPSVAGWLTGSILLIPSGGSSRTLKVQPLAEGAETRVRNSDGASRRVLASSDNVANGK